MIVGKVVRQSKAKGVLIKWCGVNKMAKEIARDGAILLTSFGWKWCVCEITCTLNDGSGVARQ